MSNKAEWKRDIAADEQFLDMIVNSNLMLACDPGAVVKELASILPHYITRVRELEAEIERRTKTEIADKLEYVGYADGRELYTLKEEVQVKAEAATAPTADLPLVEVYVEGGLVDWVNMPPGVRVIVRDYDIEGADEENIVTDKDGDECTETEWFADGSVRQSGE